jgi:hypothetical protein
MHRRELFRLLSAGALVPALSPELFALLRQAQPSSTYTVRTFDSHQNATVVAMIDLIIPATATPGAKGARVNEFMDVILTDWATAEERTNFLVGLETFDAQSNALFSKRFVDATTEQQTALLSSFDDSVVWNSGSGRHHGSIPSKDRDTQLRGEFFRVFKTMTIHGYYTSEIGFTRELQLEIIPGAQHGCVAVHEEKKA